MDAWVKDRQDRSKYPRARKHPFLFVATNGSPITLRGARAVFERLRSVYPELGGICQHILRHDANDRWITGPLTEMEYRALQARLRSPAASSLPLRERVTTWLLLCFGSNPKNLRLLLEEDLLRTRPVPHQAPRSLRRQARRGTDRRT